MRLGKLAGVTGWVAPSNLAAGSMASSAGKAKVVPKPFKKLRRGSCHLFRMIVGVTVDWLN